MSVRWHGLLLAMTLPAWALAQTPAPTAPKAAGRDVAVYQPKHEDPVLEEMRQRREQAAERAKQETEKIREAAKARQVKEQRLRFDVSAVSRPASPEAFRQVFHFPPVAQYNTGTCWSFSTTSFYEAEVARLTGERVKLSELYTVYWEYVAKVRRFVRERGDSLVAEGSEGNAVPRIWKEHGVVPAEAYPGVLSPDGRHDHAALIGQLQLLTEWVRANDIWDEGRVVGMARVILDAELGPPPQEVTYKGARHTPQEFLAKVLKLDMDAYVDLVSTLSFPFYTRGEHRVPDNWWHDASYVNVPLDEWFGAIVKAVQAGYSVELGGDVSEPGYQGFEDLAVVPSFDIPQAFIDQSARELRIANGTTEDDHGLHLVGHVRHDGHDWFLIKDSGRSARWGRHEGYYLYRDDYVRLKMLSFTVHRDAVKELLAKLPQQV